MNYAEKVKAKIQHIKDHPEAHRHDFAMLSVCCTIDGCLDTKVMQAHTEHVNFGINGGQRCDVSRGPCACGAWH